MKEIEIDDLDQQLIQLLVEDGRMPVGELAKRLHVTAPTVRTRIKKLQEDGLLRISGMINPELCKDVSVVLIGIRVQTHGKLDQELERISSLDRITWAAVVTGQYDIMAEAIITGGMTELYQLMNEHIFGPMVVQSETYMIMKSNRKWICPQIGRAHV